MKIRILALFAFTLIVFQNVSFAVKLSPQATISILTCSPGEEVYSIYGHSAIRINDPEQGIDAVFNYGVFSFNAPHFIYRFAKGQTDYLLAVEDFRHFLPQYQEEKRSVYEQVLNLSPEEKQQLTDALILNAQPENREYRYNFFTDNCSTRVRDMIARNVPTIAFPQKQTAMTYRNMIRLYHDHFRWIELGIDLLVGKKAEQIVSPDGEMFLPDFLMSHFAQGSVSRNGMKEPLVSSTRTLVEFPRPGVAGFSLTSPFAVFAFLFLVIAVISIRGYIRRKPATWLTNTLLVLSGLSGVIIGWFTLYSEHPAMSPNYNLLWAFPANLLFVFIWNVKKWRTKTHWYFFLPSVVLMLSFFSGQQFNPSVYFLMASLLICYTTQIGSHYRRATCE